MKKYTFLLLIISCRLAIAALPVVDIPGWVQRASSLMNQANEINNQVQQYQMQARHYEEMLTSTKTNLKSLSTFQWDSANQVINNLLESTNTIDYYKQEAGSLTKYLDRFKDTEFYKKSACSTGHCSKNEIAKINKSKLQASVAQKRANDAMLKGIDKQQDSIKKDSEKLLILQSKAETAEGQKQALQAAAQLASNQSHQLLQIRGLMMAQQNAQATHYAAKANKEAIKDAGDERFRQGEYHKSKEYQW